MQRTTQNMGAFIECTMSSVLEDYSGEDTPYIKNKGRKLYIGDIMEFLYDHVLVDTEFDEWVALEMWQPYLSGWFIAGVMENLNKIDGSDDEVEGYYLDRAIQNMKLLCSMKKKYAFRAILCEINWKKNQNHFSPSLRGKVRYIEQLIAEQLD